ncbi:ROK family protein [Stackebrandtia nassauensis]|uniref:ROK family protein n=1 Tax=Stackebrandtia nassauensis (strain DSM 44728 / CIP 108903 / NRRL B-16338 / NBRC 102104 / LLR-40K-21) TaxID=446470 RepID=D3Q3B5_STANL|nr:ROK family protein [Stackebrandtia nassauensis]ADD41956.1 ROK family protein [Stackebrandtia nassauensis DSM 44728]
MELCVDFGGTELKLGIIDRGTPVRTSAIPVDEADLALAKVAATRLIDAAAPARPTAVGIAVPGVVDRAAGRLVKAHDKQQELADLDLVVWAKAAFGLPAVVENDARAALVGEISTGSAPGATDAVLVTLGTGIGTAAVMDGVLLRGAHDHAGILGGHLTVDLDGGLCNCGNVGCAESIAGAWALRRELAARGDAVTDVKELFAAAEAGDADAVALRDRAIRAWGACVVSLCHAYDPRVVILSGGIMRAGTAVGEPIQTYVHKHLWSSSHRPAFVIPDRPDLSVLRGLSVLAADDHSQKER